MYNIKTKVCAKHIQFTTSSRRLDGGAYCGAPVGGILILLAGFVLFSTVVFLGDLEIYFFVSVSRQ